MASPLKRWFVDHPASVGETYGEHFGVASRFGLTMIRGGFVCLIHALFPALFERTGSTAIKQLYGEMTARQPGDTGLPHEDARWQIEYEI